MAVTSKLNFTLVSSETLDTGAHLSEEPTVGRQPTGVSNKALSSTSTPSIDDVWSREITLDGAGEAIIDLTALTDGNLPTKDWTGKRIKAMLIHVLASATGPMTFEADATDGYDLFGGPGGVSLGVDDWLPGLFGNASRPAVGAAAKRIKVTGTAAEIFEIHLEAA